MSTGFSPATAMTGPPPDPTKHVDYALGMILGVDEFTQEFAYLSERDRWAVRDLSGYGALWGLAVSTRMNGSEPEVVVAPGVGVSPRGRLIRVTPAQCASLNTWLKAHTEDLQDRGLPVIGNSSDRVYVVLSYRECETDLLPIPGEPCRNEADTLKPSRVTDDFQLELRFDPPDQSEEDAIIDFVRWLRAHIEVSPTPGSSIAPDVFVSTIRDARVPPPLSPPAWPPFSPGSPADYLLDSSPPGPVPVYSGDLPSYLRTAFRLWVTELRPLWRPNWLGEVHSCTGTLTPQNPADGDALLVCELVLPLTRAPGDAQWFIAAAPGPDPLADVEIHEDRRPYLLSTRVLQEWLYDAPWPTSAATSPGPKVVAAGWVPAAPTMSGSAFGSLKAVELGPDKSQVSFTFAALSGPLLPHTNHYVFNVSVAQPPPPAAPVALKAPSTMFVGLLPASGLLPARFVVQVSDGGELVDESVLKQLYFMIEVTQYA